MQLRKTVECLAAEMARLGTGPLAELRRMEVDGPGAASFWLLAGKCGFVDAPTDKWMRIVKIMAILMPKGKRIDQTVLHDTKRPLGAACAMAAIRLGPLPVRDRVHSFLRRALRASCRSGPISVPKRWSALLEC